MRVLVSAYACEPGVGSEPGVGWAWIQMLSTLAEVTVITRANNRSAIESASANESWVRRVQWVYFDLPEPFRRAKKITGAVQAYYAAWQYAAIPLARRVVVEQKIDVLHHLTFGSYWMPCMAGWVDVPLVLGPLGGAESAPLGFASDRLRSLLFEAVRSLARRMAECEPSVRRSTRKAIVLVAKAPETEARLGRLGARNVVLRSEVVLDPVNLGVPAADCVSSDVLRIVSVGRLHHLKGYQLALSAIAAARHRLPPFSYTIIGEGPHRAFLEKTVRALGLDDVVALEGARPHASILPALVAADIFVHPSLHDSGGWACVEAMSAGLPVVCLDLGGPAAQVTHETGVRVAAVSRAASIAGLAEAVVRLASDRDERERMGRAGQDRVAAMYTRSSQLEWLETLYRDIGSRLGQT